MATDQEIERGVALLASSRHTHLLASDFPACWVLGYGVPGDLRADGVSANLYIDLGNREFWHSYHYRNESWRKSPVQPSSVAVDRDRAITFEADQRRADEAVVSTGYSSQLHCLHVWGPGRERWFGYGSPVELGIPAISGIGHWGWYVDFLTDEVWSGTDDRWVDSRDVPSARQRIMTEDVEDAKASPRICPFCSGTGCVDVIEKPDVGPPTRRIFLQEETE